MLLTIDREKSAIGADRPLADPTHQAPVMIYRLTPGRRRQITDFIDAHLDRPLRVLEMASHLGLSPSHFSRAFHFSMKMTPHRYLMARRLSKVRVLLSTSNMPLAEIALLAGFCDQSHLSRYFRDCFGMTPRSFRRQYRSLPPGPAAAECLPGRLIERSSAVRAEPG
jgi:transcriptional regulator GlxA family with amidase domain